MSTTDVHPAPHHGSQPGWFARAEAWLDERGKGAWITAMVLGFIFVWPVGLALLAYMIWSKRMFNWHLPHKRTAYSNRTTLESRP